MMREDFSFLRSSDLITPAEIDPGYRRNAFLRVVARLKPEATLEQARAERDAITAQLEEVSPRPNQSERLVADFLPLHELTAEKSRLVLGILFGAVGFVLLIACANIANLLLARATSRRREMAIRAAVGASRWRLMRQLLTESMLLGLLSGIVGLLLASWGIDFLLDLAPATLSRVNRIGIDSGVLIFTMLLSLLTSIVFGLAPAYQASRLDLTEALKDGIRLTGRRFAGLSLRNLLVIGQVALALVLLTGAGLMLNSLVRLLNVNKGFDPDGLLTFNVVLPGGDFRRDGGTESRTRDTMVGFYKEAIARLNAVPGVSVATTVNQLPLGEMGLRGGFEIENMASLDESWWARKVITGPGYFRAMRIPVKGGREFEDVDTDASRNVAVVNEAFARKYLDGGDPLGRRVAIDSDSNREPVWREVVGIVGDFKQATLGSEFEPAIFVPFAQTSRMFWLDSSTFVVRTEVDPKSLALTVQREIQAVDPEIPAFSVRTMNEVIADSASDPRFNATLFAVFAGLALVLAGVGIYGVISYSVTLRTHEMGIRLAIGASPGELVKMVVAQGALLASMGTGLGLVAAYALTRLMKSLLFGIEATDPATFVGVTALLMVVAIVASFIPARRAARVDPMVALRYE
jgi:putative ABC transport system permease protein